MSRLAVICLSITSLHAVAISVSSGTNKYSAISSEQLNAKNFLSEDEISDVRRRRMEGLEIPDAYYERCHFWVNAVRARESLPALKRWTEMESCSDKMSEYDYTEYTERGRAHAAMIDNVGCDFFASGVRAYAQNSCPLWTNNEKSIESCTVQMWDEKTNPGVTIVDDRMECDGPYDSQCGHYYNLRGGRDSYEWYNKYDRVACGFYISPTAGAGDALYINQNFGAVQTPEFLCGGDKSTKPSDALIGDCTDRSNTYDDCPGDLKMLDEYGCDYNDCDISYTGECVDEHWGCSHFTLVEGECGGRYFWTGGDSTDVFYFTEVCRESCGTCACDVASDPTPSPTDQPNPTFNPTSGPAPTPNPTNAPAPTPNPTSVPAPPVASPTPSPTNPPVASPTTPPNSSPVVSPTPSPTSPAACQSAQSGKLKGTRVVYSGISDVCSCESTCRNSVDGAIALHYRASTQKCFCFTNPRVVTGGLQIFTNANFVYLEL